MLEGHRWSQMVNGLTSVYKWSSTDARWPQMVTDCHIWSIVSQVFTNGRALMLDGQRWSQMVTDGQ